MYEKGRVSSRMETGASEQTALFYLAGCGQYIIAECVSDWIIFTVIVIYQRMLNKSNAYV